MTSHASKRLNSKSAIAKCSCNKVVQDDDPSGIGCHGCAKWFHGQCVSLSDDDVKWLGSKKNCLWVCDACVGDDDSAFLPEAKSKSLSLINENITSCLNKIVPKLIKESLPSLVDENLKKVVSDSLPSPHDAMTPTSVSDVVKKSLDERDYDKKAEKTIVIYNLKDSSEPVSKDPNFIKVLEDLSIPAQSIQNATRLGKLDTLLDSRPRPVEIELHTSFDRRIAMSNVSRLKGTKLFVKPKYLWRERLVEKSLLQIRYNLCLQMFEKSKFRIRNLKLFYDGVAIDHSQKLEDIVASLQQRLQSAQND